MRKVYKNVVDEIRGKKIIFLSFSSGFMCIENMIKTYGSVDSYIVDGYTTIHETILLKENEKINNSEYIFLIYLYVDNNTKATIQKTCLKLIRFFSKNKIYNYKIISEDDFAIIYNSFYFDYFVSKGINLSDTLLQIDMFVCDNFFPVDHKGEIFFEIGDSILPSFFDDYTVVYEGSHEYSNVRLKKGDVVFDCGANIGSFSAIALSKGCEVHAFEPIPKTYSMLKHFLRHYPRDKQYLRCYGLGDKEEIAEFNIKSTNRSSSMFLNINMVGIEKVHCPIMTIDQYVNKNNIQKVDFIKADIEGAERYMLLGATETLKNYAPKLSICTYHFQDDPEIIESIIRSANENYVIEHKWNKIYAYI